MNTDPSPRDTTPPQCPTELATPRSLDERIAEQGVAQTATFEHLLGRGAELWLDDAEFDAFLHHLRAIRQEKE